MIRVRTQPNQFAQVPDLYKVFERAALKASPKIAALYEATYDTWDEKPTLQIKITPRRLEVQLTGEKAIHWKYIDEGTAPRDILPKASNKSGKLHFQAGWQAKTSRGSLSSGSGGKSGPYVHPTQVGGDVTAQQSIEARHWSPLIREKTQSIMREEITKALRIATLVKGRTK